VTKKTAASTKKSIKVPKPTATDEELKLTTLRTAKVSAEVNAIKCYKTAKNPIVEQAATVYSPISTLNKRNHLLETFLLKLRGVHPWRF
jgi:hypothetical protein